MRYIENGLLGKRTCVRCHQRRSWTLGALEILKHNNKIWSVCGRIWAWTKNFNSKPEEEEDNLLQELK